MKLVQACIHPAHGSRSDPVWKSPGTDAISDLLEVRISSLGQLRAGSAGCFRPSIMLNKSIIDRLGGCHADPASLRPVHRACACGCARCGRRHTRPAATASCRCRRWNGMPRSSARPLISTTGCGPSSPRSNGRSSRPTSRRSTRSSRSATRSSWRTTTRRRKSTTASPISSATRSSSRARRPRSMPRSSSNAACISWPRPRRSSTPTRPC